MSGKSLGGFMPVNYIFDHPESSERQFFVKLHDVNSDAKPSDRTLFVLNVPQYMKKKIIKSMYNSCGAIERVYFHSKPKSTEEPVNKSVFSRTELHKGYKVAYIVFKTPEGLKKAMKTTELPPISYIEVNSCGMSNWVREYNSSFIDSAKVQKEIDIFMSEYDAKIEEEKRNAQEVETADEDGWITITKHSKKPKISRNEAVSKKLVDKHKREESKKTLLNFYRCQLRQSKMEHLLELRKKFEKDKERIAQMRANRKFKPF